VKVFGSLAGRTGHFGGNETNQAGGVAEALRLQLLPEAHSMPTDCSRDRFGESWPDSNTDVQVYGIVGSSTER
jgi:hypothetical protein